MGEEEYNTGAQVELTVANEGTLLLQVSHARCTYMAHKNVIFMKIQQRQKLLFVVQG